MSKHTDKPWKVGVIYDERGMILDGKGLPICAMVRECDCNLIAAAPELLEICKIVVSNIQGSHITPKNHPLIFSALIILRKAILKAEAGVETKPKE